jgi:hypothetical protein
MFGHEANENDRRDRSDHAARSDIFIVHDDARAESSDRHVLLVLCVGISGLIVADLLVLVYFWVI